MASVRGQSSAAIVNDFEATLRGAESEPCTPGMKPRVVVGALGALGAMVRPGAAEPPAAPAIHGLRLEDAIRLALTCNERARIAQRVGAARRRLATRAPAWPCAHDNVSTA